MPKQLIYNTITDKIGIHNIKLKRSILFYLKLQGHIVVSEEKNGYPYLYYLIKCQRCKSLFFSQYRVVVGEQPCPWCTPILKNKQQVEAKLFG